MTLVLDATASTESESESDLFAAIQNKQDMAKYTWTRNVQKQHRTNILYDREQTLHTSTKESGIQTSKDGIV